MKKEIEKLVSMLEEHFETLELEKGNEKMTLKFTDGVCDFKIELRATFVIEFHMRHEPIALKLEAKINGFVAFAGTLHSKEDAEASARLFERAIDLAEEKRRKGAGEVYRMYF